MRLIDADALWKHLICDIDSDTDIATIGEYIDDAPTIDAVEVTHGKWIEHRTEKDGTIMLWECSECGVIIYSDSEADRCKFHKWCGRCGAKMEV